MSKKTVKKRREGRKEEVHARIMYLLSAKKVQFIPLFVYCIQLSARRSMLDLDVALSIWTLCNHRRWLCLEHHNRFLVFWKTTLALATKPRAQLRRKMTGFYCLSGLASASGCETMQHPLSIVRHENGPHGTGGINITVSSNT